jgi:amino acid adenylation domain-containing protein
MVDQLVFVLGSLVDNPTQPVGAVGIFPPSELTQILSNWNETAAEYSSDHTIHGLIDERARQTPEATAVVGSGMSLSYRLLLERADSVAVRLQNLGVGPDRPVGIRLERSAGMVVAMLGVLKAGGAYVPLDPRLPEGRLQFILDETGAAALIVAVDSAAGLASPALQSLPLLQISDAGELSEPDIEGRLQTEEAVSPENLAYVMYTSGSTGRPKGVAVTHRNLVHSTLARVAYYQQSPRSYLLLSPFTFDSSVAGIFWTLTQGGTLVLPGPQMEQDIDHLGLLIDTHRVSHLLALPAVYSLILEQVPMERLRSLETVIVAGEPCQPTLARQHFKRASGARLYNEYGPTEATVWCTVEGVKPIKSGASVLSERVPIGRPISNTKAYILDESLRPVPVGVVGELCIGGDGLARGYLRQPELTMEKFVDRDLTGTGPSRIYRTGDLARFLPDGTIDLVGRLDHQVKVRGRRIELDEIVKIMIEHPDIVSAAATVKQMSPGNDEIVGYYVAGEGRSPSLSDLRAHLRDRLPEYMVPSHFVGLDALPTMENGKLDRLALPDPDGRSRPATGFHAPRTWAELLVTEACAELLGVPDVGIDDNFFDLGGHSLLSMQFISKLAAATGVRVSPTVILLNTLGYAAALIQESTPPEKAPSFSTSSAQSAGLPATNTPLATPFFFGSAGERIFGMHYAPTASATGRAILVCPPVGWEYYRTHWALRKLARLLASRGHHVLRFDYSGVGDSWGSPHTASLHRWVADVRTAAVELAAISSSDGLSVIGLRLGATLSVLATEGGLAAERLVMWDPVLNGRQHLATLQGMHDEMFSRKKVGRVRPGDARDELLGFPYSDALRTELGSIDLSATSWTGPDAVLVASQPRPEYQDLLTVAHGSVRLDVIDDAGIWDDAGAVHSALLPARIPAHIAALVGDPA